jgi:hypothetical protein
LLDVSGKIIKVFNIKNNKEVFDVTELPQGLYILKLKNGQSIKILKAK